MNLRGVYTFLVLLAISLPQLSAAAQTEYAIQFHESEPNEPRQVLLVTSLGNGAFSSFYKQQIIELQAILRSHWHTEFTTVAPSQLNAIEREEFSHLLIIEQSVSPATILQLENFAEAFSGQVFWLGCSSSGADIRYEDEVQAVTYKDVSFTTGAGMTLCGSVADEASRGVVLASMETASGTEPLIVQIDKALYTPMYPPSYYTTPSYSTPFLDAFHIFFDTAAARTGATDALLRLEDVNPHTYYVPRLLRSVYQYLNQSGVHYNIAFIPHYRNPGEDISLTVAEADRFADLHRQAVKNDHATLIQHGTTHQYGESITGVGFEFWDESNNQPLTHESDFAGIEYVYEKVNEAKELMRQANLPVPDIWETPHYAQSENEDAALNHLYPLRYEHIFQVGSLPFPVAINGSIYIPENLGYVINEGDLEEKEVLLAQLQTFTGAVPSLFWHPWRDRFEIEYLVTLLQENGYTFVSAYDVISTINEPATTTELAAVAGSTTRTDTYWLINAFAYFVIGFFILGVITYIKNFTRLYKYVRQVKGFSLTTEKLMKETQARGRELPHIGLLVPARNEGLVIGNTIRRVAALEYPKSCLQVYIIVDERELDDDVPETTKSVARRAIAEVHEEHQQNFVQVIEVPKWYGGIYGDRKESFGRSTKGRALNYALEHINTETTEMIGVLDADGRLHNDVLKEVAYKRVTDNSALLQGPVFQVSNWRSINMIGKAAGLELALHHLTELAHRLLQPNKMQFLAGTNYFVETKAIQSIGGWDQHALVEDAEVALRLYTRAGIIGQWINSPEIEQSPANFAVYRKQRERWVRGHIELLSQVWHSSLGWREKLYFSNKIVFSQVRFLWDLGIPIASIILLIMGAFLFLHPAFVYITIILLICSVFIWDTYGLVLRNIAPWIDTDATLLSEKIWYSLRLITLLPLLIVIQAIPRVEALFNYYVKGNQIGWYKTERTAEAVVTNIT
ncbi:DUF2334 domain-containing protein [Candidatus Pacebacteria bacterium]|nr:DUF2334 domain-containing protein [Candidatus Paceibacterota bacterium]